MKNIFKIFFLGLFSLMLTGAFASEKGTHEEAKAIVKKAEAYLKKNSVENFLKEVQNPKGEFRDKDLYISVYDLKGIVLSHGVNPKLIGKDVSALDDPDKVPFMKIILEKSKTEGGGEVKYKWPHPETKEYEKKIAFFKRVGDIIVSCGTYQ